MDCDKGRDLLVSGSGDESIAFIKLREGRIIKKYENLGNFVYGIRFI